MERSKKNRFREYNKVKIKSTKRLSLNRLWISIYFCLPLLRGIFKPYWLSYPSIGEVKQWWPLGPLAKVYPIFVAYLLWVNATEFIKTGNLDGSKLVLCIRSIVIFFLSVFVFFSIKLFFIWYDNPVGKYLLWSPNSYYLTKIWEYARPYVYHGGAGIVFGIFFYLLFKLTRGRVVEKNEVLLGILLGLIFGIERTLIVVIGAFILTVFWFIIQKIRKIEIATMRVTPSLFITSYLMLLYIW